MGELFSSTASGTVSSGGTTAPASGTTETWTVNVSTAFPVVSSGAGTFFNVAEPGAAGEVIRVTAAPGGTGTQTWTVTRGAQATTPIAHVAGFTVYNMFSSDWGNLVTQLITNPLAPSGAIMETFPRQASNTPAAVAKTSGTLYLSAIGLPVRTTLGHITYPSALSGGATSPTNWWFALYDNSFNLLAITADQTTTAWSGNTSVTLAIATIASGASSTFTTTYTGLHYVGIMMAAATPVMTVRGSGNVQNGIHQIAPYLGGPSDTGLTAPSTFPHTATSITGGNATPPDYAWVS